MEIEGEKELGKGSKENTDDEIPVGNETGGNEDDVDMEHLEIDLQNIHDDRIGNTAYSSTWVLRCLLSISELAEETWSPELDQNLCMLWDMSTEKDVVDFLVKTDFVILVDFTLRATKAPRAYEIVLGILCNMCCYPDVMEQLVNSSGTVHQIFIMLSREITGPEVIVQIIKIMQYAVCDAQVSSRKLKWLSYFKECPYLDDAIDFILRSSTDEELLSNTIELIRLFCFTTLPDRPGSLLSEIFLPIAGLVPGLLEAFKQLSSDSDDAHSDKMLKIIENWLRTFTIILETDFVIIVEDFENIVEVLSRILRPYKDINNLVSMSNDETNYIHDCVEIIHWFQKNHKRLDEPVIQMIVTILYELRGVVRCENAEILLSAHGTMEDLVKYLKLYWIDLIKRCSEEDILKILWTCDSNVKNCLMEIAAEYHKASQSDSVIDRLVESLGQHL